MNASVTASVQPVDYVDRWLQTALGSLIGRFLWHRGL